MLLMQLADLSLKYMTLGSELDFLDLLTKDQKDLTWCRILFSTSLMYLAYNSRENLMHLERNRWNSNLQKISRLLEKIYLDFEL